MGIGPFPEVKQPGRGLNDPPPSRVEVKEKYCFTIILLCALMAGYRVNFTFYSLQIG
jgi:hypothetical protein